MFIPKKLGYKHFYSIQRNVENTQNATEDNAVFITTTVSICLFKVVFYFNRLLCILNYKTKSSYFMI